MESSLKEPLILEDEDNQKNLSIAKDTKEITESINVEKSTELLKDNEIYKENKIQENTTTENNIKISKISDFFSYLLVFLISFVALIILLDTLKSPLINVFPGLEIVLFNLFETLKDVKLFIIDLT
jgi:cytochrome oxidase assembly protein ShyY1